MYKNLICGNKFVPEEDDGNIEYKLRLDMKDTDGCSKLKTQMLWRVNRGFEKNGKYEAQYVLGIYDNGDIGKFTEE